MQYIVNQVSEQYAVLTIKDAGKQGDAVWKLIDPWGFAVLDDVKHSLKMELDLHFSVRIPSESEKPKLESLKRRLSYLTAVNSVPITLTVGAQQVPLYSLQELQERPGETVREESPPRSDDDAPGRLEKDFQTYLVGKGLRDKDSDEAWTNERLALFGKDFFGIKRRQLGITREFATGAFAGQKKEVNRVLPTEFIDLVTFNNSGNIAVIELKFYDGSAKLEVISQVFNYALFFFSYREKLSTLLDHCLGCDTSAKKVDVYHVSNRFHARFDTVWEYYSKQPISIKKVIMGYME